MRFWHNERPPEAADDAAIWWDTRRRMDPARFADDNGFAEWLAADPAHAEAWEKTRRRDAMIGGFASMPEVRAMRAAALDRARGRTASGPRRWLIGAALAASMVGGIALIDMPGLSDGGTPVATDDVRRYATAVGQRREVVLADGSTVTLNTASSMEVRSSADRRDVRLLQGQAMFRVAHDAQRPFVVAVGDREVTALGTAFDVRLRPEGQIQVLLLEGKVQVDPTRRQGLAWLIPSLARTTLAPGQQLVAQVAGGVDVTMPDMERATAWSRGVLVFRNDSVADAIREVNRYSADQLVVDDPSLAQLRVSGVFPTASSRDFLAALEALYPVRVEAEEGGMMRLAWREPRADR